MQCKGISKMSLFQIFCHKKKNLIEKTSGDQAQNIEEWRVMPCRHGENALKRYQLSVNQFLFLLKEIG